MRNLKKANKLLGSSEEADCGETSGVVRDGLTEEVTLKPVVERQEGASPMEVQGREFQARGTVSAKAPRWERTRHVGWKPILPCVEGKVEAGRKEV